MQVTIPNEDTEDKLIWNQNAKGILSLSDAYVFKKQSTVNLHWDKNIWCIDIPPSKSLIAWRLLHDKMPTDDKLKQRGCNLPHQCALCVLLVKKLHSIFFLMWFCFQSLVLVFFYFRYSFTLPINY